MNETPQTLTRRGMAARLTDEQWAEVRACCSEIRSWPGRTVISRKHDPLDRSLLLVEGLIARHVPGPDRALHEMVALEVPGDFVDLHSFPIGTLDHDVTAITDARLAVLPHDRLKEMMDRRPDVALALWALTVVDASIHRYWSFRVGALRATGRVANLLCELQSRLEMAGLADETGFHLPLTQVDLSEACGLSPVHVNRVIRELREAGHCTVKDGRVTIFDLKALRRTGKYDPSFLEIGIQRDGL
ncbi:Crp/Fnr family transcriptional regulator [uncultured Jannaschia sp.]|uniref:Crp/Fnr family transcriptional regulator n=1 Tax=uncultured Jannaschia sp. TaxID=293347 RepID=UPI002612A8D4|nr:Crp/Fnr family transcriptional regulator [uncultured Jannaschia sp.]